MVGSGPRGEVYGNAAGIGLVPEGFDIRPDRAARSDVVIVSAPIGVHGVVIMSVREGVEFGSLELSDTAALTPLVQAVLGVTSDVHLRRDPRGGLATSLDENASGSGVGVRLVEKSIPVPADVANACAMLGLDPMYVANEGKLVEFESRTAVGHG